MKNRAQCDAGGGRRHLCMINRAQCEAGGGTEAFVYEKPSTMRRWQGYGRNNV
ncbi:hypothetical protein PAT3040_04775 [Paenibacillus agaridevorans]|uniref:Uncharacterized protein n=1 Tax=Paenibacillus agaridevorans TaxID=171404 RepID=A0A2R5EVB5_9BACL|nr:hypothetical protein PAT3040_04775 [Paenibacillus agaridevorans]